jgi:hypothetical protein
LHPFDIKTVVFAKHAQHVVLIHFPIALFIIGVSYFLHNGRNSACRLPRPTTTCSLRRSHIPVVATGILAWQWNPEGTKTEGIPDASGDGMRVKRPDLCGVVHPHENPAETRRGPARIPLAD